MFCSKLILYVEDDENYAELLKFTLDHGKFKHKLLHMASAEEAMAYLKGEDQFSDRIKFPLPSVVLVDLKMPRVNGFEFLDWIRRHSEYSYLPVIVLTTSEEIQDVTKAYRLGANSFLVKPPNIDDLKSLVQMLEGYWIRFNVNIQDTSFFKDPTSLKVPEVAPFPPRQVTPPSD